MDTSTEQLLAELRRLLPLIEAAVGEDRQSESAQDHEPIQGVDLETLARVRRYLAEGRCLICDEIKDSKYSRGCCSSCYQAAYNKVKKKRLTEDELVSAGMWAPKGMVPVGKKSATPPKLDELEARVASQRPTPPKLPTSQEAMETWLKYKDETEDETLQAMIERGKEETRKLNAPKEVVPKKKAAKKKAKRKTPKGE